MWTKDNNFIWFEVRMQNEFCWLEKTAAAAYKYAEYLLDQNRHPSTVITVIEVNTHNFNQPESRRVTRVYTWLPQADGQLAKSVGKPFTAVER